MLLILGIIVFAVAIFEMIQIKNDLEHMKNARD